MRPLAVLAFAAAFVPCAAAAAPASAPACLVGAYRAADGDLMALVRKPDAPQALAFVQASGQTGLLTLTASGDLTGTAQTPRGAEPLRLQAASCATPTLRLEIGGHATVWTRRPLARTPVRFDSDGASLAGQLVTLAGPAARRPVVVFTHGSEATAAIDVNPMPLLMAAQGLTAFVYDKRGTGGSGGTYTQDFVRLGEDGAAAIRTARKLTRATAASVGVWGGSQGGWIAPYAARATKADFVIVAYGVVGTPVEQDIWQIDYELAHLPPYVSAGAQDDVHKLTQTTARIAESAFRDHLEDLETLRAEYGGKPWFARLEGQYTGILLRGEIERARRESPEVIWKYDALAVMRSVEAPQLWIMAAEDSVAPSAPSLRRLADLQAQGKPIDIAVFPDTDHGIRRYRLGADGRRVYTGVAPGYVRLGVDWVKSAVKPPYGDATLTPAAKSTHMAAAVRR